MDEATGLFKAKSEGASGQHVPLHLQACLAAALQTLVSRQGDKHLHQYLVQHLLDTLLPRVLAASSLDPLHSHPVARPLCVAAAAAAQHARDQPPPGAAAGHGVNLARGLVQRCVTAAAAHGGLHRLTLGLSACLDLLTDLMAQLVSCETQLDLAGTKTRACESPGAAAGAKMR